PAPPPRPSDEEKEGFGLEPGSEPRLPRIRLEASFLDVFLKSRTRAGRTSASNTILPHEDVHVPRWNVGERGAIVLKLPHYVAVFVDQYSGYFSLRIGSVTSVARAGIRLHVGRGVELVLAASLIAGNIFDIHDRWESRPHGHRYRVADWTGGGPDLGLSYTF